LSLLLGSTCLVGVGCAVAPTGPGAAPSEDAGAPEALVSRDLLTDGPAEAGLDGAPTEVGRDAGADTTPAPDASDAGPLPPPSWMGPPVVVGVGQGGRRNVSRDGLKWDTMQVQDLVKAGGDPTKNFAAVAYGNGLVVAVGGGCTGTTASTCVGRLATFNGATWTEVALPAGQSWLSGVAYGGGIWVAVGAAGPWLISMDGKRWMQKGNIAVNLRAVVYGNVGGTMMFVTTGDKSFCWRSLDGMSWTNMAQLFVNDDPIPILHSLAVGDNVVVAAGEKGRRIRSTNGIEWNINTLAGGGNDLPSVVYADHMFFAYAVLPPPPAYGSAWISANAAQSWEAVVIPDGPGGAVATGVINGSRLYVGATGGTIKTSSDGRGWTTRLLGQADANAFNAFTFAGF
jgi:hypothetical protein